MKRLLQAFASMQKELQVTRGELEAMRSQLSSTTQARSQPRGYRPAAAGGGAPQFQG